METFTLQTDKNVRYQPLQNNDEENTEKHYDYSSPAKISAKSSWPWISMDIANDYTGMTMKRMSAPFKTLRKPNEKYRLFGGFLGIIMVVASICAVLFYIKSMPASDNAKSKPKENSNNIYSNQNVSHESRKEDSLMENWEKYADEFFAFGLGAKNVYTSPHSTLDCDQPGVTKMTILINSTGDQSWKDFKAEKSCADNLILIERLELAGEFTYEDLHHLFKEIPNIVSLKLSSLTLNSHRVDLPSGQEAYNEKLIFSILTSLSIIEAAGEFGKPIFDWLDHTVEMPFLSEILVMKSDIVVTPINNMLKKSQDLKSVFLIGNTIACDENSSCTPFTTELSSLIELILINGDPKQDAYWASFITSMILEVKNSQILRILETNIPTDTDVLEKLIDSEFSSKYSQVYEIAFRLPVMGSPSKNNFADRQIALFERYYDDGSCSKTVLDENAFQSVSTGWVNLCQDSQHNIMYGFNKAKFIQDDHLTIFIRRAQKGNVVCYNDFSSNNINEEFSCHNYF